MNKIIISLFLTGLLFGSGPCVASCGPFLIAYVAGAKKNVSKGIMLYILFSLARISVYVALSLVVFFFSRFAAERLLGGLYKYVLVLGGGFIMSIGLFMAFGKRLEFSRISRDPVKAGSFCQSLHKNLSGHDKKSIFTAGLIIGLLPCAPLLSIFSYVGLVSRTWLASLLYSLSFGIGTFVSPLLLLTIIAGIIPRLFLEKKAIYHSIFSFICGSTIVFLGAQLIARAF